MAGWRRFVPHQLDEALTVSCSRADLLSHMLGAIGIWLYTASAGKVRRVVGLTKCKGVSVACRLLAQLGAGQGGAVQVVVTDVREEMVAYVAGRPYLRRELEMPAAAFHHAGPLSHHVSRPVTLCVEVEPCMHARTVDCQGRVS